MRRLRLWIFGLLAAVGTIGATLYAVTVAPGAKTKLDAAVLFFTAAAAVTGYLGVLIGWLSYRLESGKVPKPDLAIVEEGKLIRQWNLEIELLDPEFDVSGAVQKERDRMEKVIASLKSPPPQSTASTATMIAALGMFKQIDDRAIATYRKAVERYLVEYGDYLKIEHAVETFWARSRHLVVAFTNERAGVPAEGVRALIRLPTDQDMRVLEPSEIPQIDEPPQAPKPPQPSSPFDFSPVMPAYNLPNLNRSLGELQDVRPQGNVSPPTLRPGSTVVEFAVKEILHNLYEDTRDHPLVLMFNRVGTWTMPYELHARNLPQPKKGTLTINVRAREGGSGSIPSES